MACSTRPSAVTSSRPHPSPRCSPPSVTSPAAPDASSSSRTTPAIDSTSASPPNEPSSRDSTWRWSSSQTTARYRRRWESQAGADSRARSSCTSARAPPPPPGIHSSSSPRKQGPRRTPWARWGSRRRLTRYLGKMYPRGPSRPASSRWASGSTANPARSPLPPRP